MTKTEIKKTAAGYPKFVEWSEEDGCFIGRCPMLFDGAVHGRDEAKVYQQLCQTTEEWVRVLLKDSTPLPESKSVSDYSGKFIVRVDPALHQRLALKAQASGESLNSLAGKALAKA